MRDAIDLLAEVGLPTDEIGLTIVAGPPVLATTFPIGARAAAALGACGVAAALPQQRLVPCQRLTLSPFGPMKRRRARVGATRP